MNKKVAILQSNYIPWKGYFDLIKSVDVFVLYDEVQFTKNDWRNRNLIKHKEGLMWLTIPVRNTGLSQKISETKVLQSNWYKKHWNSISLNYSKTKSYKEVNELIKSWYLQEDHSEFLSKINEKFIRSICEFLDINTTILNSLDLDLKGDKNERLVDACKKLNASHYVSGPAAKSYLNEKIFTENNISVEWFDYSGYKEYEQLYPPFEHRVSVLDLILNEGSNATNFLKTNS